MFERFRRSHASQTTEGSVATRDPDIDERDDAARFERDRATTTTGDTTLDRDRAREDLGRDETAGGTATETRHDEEHHHGRDAALAGGGAAAGAAAMRHHEHREAEREEMAREDAHRDDVAAFHDDETGTRTATGEPTMLQDRPGERPVARERDLDRDGIDDGLERHDPVLAPAALETMRARQRDSFGGIQWGSDFFGWLCAIGLASLLTAALVGAGVALGLSTDDASNTDTAQQIGLGGGIALLCVLAIAWLCGGYVAGRMARFDGARQGVGVWLWTLLAAIVVAAVALIGGNEYDVFARLNLPRIAIGDSTLNAGGAIAGAAAVVVTLLFAVIGGKMGERFHRRVDRVATADYVVERER